MRQTELRGPSDCKGSCELVNGEATNGESSLPCIDDVEIAQRELVPQPIDPEDEAMAHIARIQHALKCTTKRVATLDTSFLRVVAIGKVEPVGASPVTKTLAEVFEKHPINMWRIEFRDPLYEKDFMAYYSCKAFKCNRRLLLVGMMGLFLYAGVFAAVFGPYYERFTVTFATESMNPINFIDMPALYGMM
ncbi:hypothetical protein HDU67_009859 [Dinochytrium kinnereticum]|nr:hypothetical protein HDU67_009859 [Dinochytrium kinnereticum]